MGPGALEFVVEISRCRAPLHRSTTHAVRPAADVELYSATALYSALQRSTALQLYSALHSTSSTPSLSCCSAASKQKMAKNPGKTRKYLGFFRHFRVLPALDTRDRRGSLPGLPYCCSAGLTLATVVGEPHCCSVVAVNTSNTVQLFNV